MLKFWEGGKNIVRVNFLFQTYDPTTDKFL